MVQVGRLILGHLGRTLGGGRLVGGRKAGHGSLTTNTAGRQQANY